MSALAIRENLVLLIGLILSIAVHEFGHAISATKLGDDTPGNQGRVTLNPIAHMDPIGTLLAPILFLFVLPGSIFFGWGRPVKITPGRFTRRISMRRGDTLVALAGPAMNLVMAMVLSGVLVGALAAGMDPASPILGAYHGQPYPFFGLRGVIMLNFILAAFNLLPIPPLDGGHLLLNAIPAHHRKVAEFIEQYGMWILLAVLMTGILGVIFGPVERLALDWLGWLGTIVS